MAAKKESSAKAYSEGASAKVARAMHKRKKGTLKSGRSGNKVTSTKQAIAIGLAEARAEGKTVPTRQSAKKSATRKSATRKPAASKKKASSKKK